MGFPFPLTVDVSRVGAPSFEVGGKCIQRPTKTRNRDALVYARARGQSVARNQQV